MYIDRLGLSRSIISIYLTLSWNSTRLQASDAEYIIVLFVCIELFLLGRTSAVNYNLFDKVFQLYLSCRRWRNSNNMIVKVSSFSK